MTAYSHRLTRWLSSVAAVTLAAGLFPLSPVHAVVTAEDEPVTLAVSAGVAGVVEADAAVLTTVTVTNPGDTGIGAGTVDVTLNRTPLTTSDALTAWLTDGTSTGTFTPLSSTSTAPVGADAAVSASANATAPDVDGLAPGVYPIQATFTAPDLTTPVASTSVLIVDDPTQTATVAVMVPITATPASGALLSADELSDLTATDGALTAALDGVTGTSAILAVDPAIVAAIRVLGDAAPASATAWLDRLRALPNERFTLQFADTDATTQAQLGLPTMLTVPDLSSYLDQEALTTPAPTPTPPSTTPLSLVPGAVTDVVWPSSDVTASVMTTIAGYLGDNVITVLPSGRVDAPGAVRVNAAGRSVLAAHQNASQYFSQASTLTADTARAQALSAGLAEISLMGPTATVLVALDRNETRTAPALQETIVAADNALATPATLSALRALPPSPGAIIDATDAGRGAALQSLLDDEQVLTRFATILDDPQVLLTPERIRILRTFAVGTIATVTDAVATHRAETQSTLNAVSVQELQPVQLLTAAAPLPVWVRNDLPWPVNVRLNAVPSNVRLAVQPVTDVVAGARSNTRVTVAVEARVASGELLVDFSLTSPTGEPIGTGQTADVTVRAEWENIGLTILGAFIVLLISVGIIRTVLRRRKARAALETEPDAAGAGAEAGESADVADTDTDHEAEAADAPDDATPDDAPALSDDTATPDPPKDTA